ATRPERSNSSRVCMAYSWGARSTTSPDRSFPPRPGPGPSWKRGLEAELRAQLHLPRRQRLLVEAVGHAALHVLLRVAGEGAPAEDVVDLAEIRAVEDVEGFDQHVEGAGLAEVEALAEPQVADELRRHGAAVAGHAGGRVGGVRARAVGRE